MTIVVVLAILALFVALAARQLCCCSADTVASTSVPLSERLCLAGITGLAISTVAGSLLATIGWFTPGWIAVVWGGLATGLWIRRPRGPWERIRFERSGWLLLACLVTGAVLRFPLLPADLGGRDQGTYALRARHTARTGAVGLRAPAIAEASREVGTRSGPSDILGLSPLVPQRHPRAGHYDGPYRPGFYLADRHTGVVTPQFLHGHPTLLALGEHLFGVGRGPWIMYLHFLLATLAIWSIARRLWPGVLGPTLATGVYVSTPLLIWVQRIPLTESFAGVLLLGAGLLCLRLRDETIASTGQQPSPVGSTAHLLAWVLATFSWIRGDLWMVLPVLAAILSLRPRGQPTLSPVGLLGCGALASFVVHVLTSYPYLHDEIQRQTGMARGLAPGEMLGLAGIAAVTWWLADRLVAKVFKPRPQLRTRLVVASLWLLVAVTIGGLATYLLTVSTPGPPYSRLDPARPLLGPGLLVLALIGAALCVKSWRPKGLRWEVWLLALLAIPCISIFLYARKNLPHATLYYYGRYLVPSLLPVCILAATHALLVIRRVLLTRMPALLAHTGFVALVALNLWPTLGPLITDPQTRLQEFAGADDLIAFLGKTIPPDALVIAGGEGWHHTHTFNQVGAALAVGLGIEVLPYRTREAAYATLYEQLIAKPRATGQPARPVFLLVNEATHLVQLAQTRKQGDGESHGDGAHGQATRRVASFDDRLPPPFVATQIDFLELFTHRLTPVSGRVPTAVTRSELRMVLVQVEVDLDRDRRGEQWMFVDGKVRGPPGLDLRGARFRGGQLCLDPKKPLEFVLPRRDTPGSAVLVGAPGSAGRAPHWPIGADGEPWIARLAKIRPRPRDTLGPFVFATRPQVIRIRGTAEPNPHIPCPHGAVTQLRLLEPDVHALEQLRTRAPERIATHRFTPPDDLGHPFPETVWTRGISLSRYRAGLRPTPDVESMAIVVRTDESVTFAPEQLPTRDPLLRVHLKRTRVAAHTRLLVYLDEKLATTIDPPDERAGHWPSEMVQLHADTSVAQISVTLAGPGEVLVRDVALIQAPNEPEFLEYVGSANE